MNQASHAEYRPDIDGLRAIAVLLVVFFHAGYTSFSGGFVGVDVFFVISGYLITNVITKNVDRGTFSYSNFYLSRIRRLAPAFVVVLATSWLLAHRVMLPDEYIAHLKLMAMSLVSIGNFYIANTTGGYFAADAESIPLLHTWSLAVEEQFYFLWPVTLVLLLKYFSHRQLRLALPLAALGFLAFSEWYSHADSIRAYYLLPARIFELLMGAMLVYHPRSDGDTKPYDSALALIGVVLICLTGLMLSKDSTFPGINALWPCLGTALIIYTGHLRNPVSRILATGPMVWIGKISYSLYLWHWVVFTFYRYVFGDLEGIHRIGCILLSIALAYVSWVIIENPFRYRLRMRFLPSLSLLVILPLLIFGGALSYIKKHDGLPARFGEDSFATIIQQATPVNIEMDCSESGKATCGEALIIGDSHAEHFKEFLYTISSNAELKTLNAAKAGCPALYGITLVSQNSAGKVVYDPYECDVYTTWLLDNLSDQRYVLISGYWDLVALSRGRYYLISSQDDPLDVATSRRNLKTGLINTLERISAAGATPVLIFDNYSISRNLFTCAMRKVTLKGDRDCSYSRLEVLAQQETTRALFSELQQQFPNLLFIDPVQAMCDEDVCHTTINGIPLFSDDNHLSWYASRLIGERYLERFDNPLTTHRSGPSTEHPSDADK